jgi:hypothetical protein
MNHLLNQVTPYDPSNDVTITPEEADKLIEDDPELVPVDPEGTEELPNVEDLTIPEETTPPVVEEDPFNWDNVINIMLIGQDRRPGEGRQRSDSMILLTVNKSKGTITLTSFMRDQYVRIPGYKNNKMNSAYAFGGMKLLNETVETNFGVKIDGDIEVDFNSFAQTNGTGTVSHSDLSRLIQQKLPTSTKLDAVKPEKLTFYYNYGERKKVPVRCQGKAIPLATHYISNTAITPDSVYVYASKQKLDSIKWVDTEDFSRADIDDTLLVVAKLQHINGVKMVPDRVNVTFQTDVLTEGEIEGVPICGLNMPEGKVLRTFPAKVTVKFVTGINVYRTLSASDFTVIADYNEIAEHPSEKCKLYLEQVPQGITRATLVHKQVDYLIEDITP